MFGRLLIFCVFFARRASASLPVFHRFLISRTANSTAPAHNWWVHEPQGRGTWDIVYSCFTTLSLCAWTAFHPNVPFKDSDTRFAFTRVGWMLVSIFLPEMVLYCAWDQWWAARCLKHEINRLGQRRKGEKVTREFLNSDNSSCEVCSNQRLLTALNLSLDEQIVGSEDSDQSPGPTTRGPEIIQDHSIYIKGPEEDRVSSSGGFVPWTTEQAYYAVCGGLAIDTSSFSKQPRMTLTAKGIVLLAEIGLLPQVSKEDVDDRSKADSIAKILVCTQAIWFLLRCFARRVYGLPLTLLEIHTMTHIACALLLYTIWFKKVYCASRPILIRDKDVINMAALLRMRPKEAEEEMWSNLGLRVEFRLVYTEHPDPETDCDTMYGEPQCAMQHDIDFESIKSLHEEDPLPSRLLAHFEAVDEAIQYLRHHNFHFHWHQWRRQRRGWMKGLWGNDPWNDCTIEWFYYPADNFLIDHGSNRCVKGRFNGHGSAHKPHAIRRNGALLITSLYGASHLSAWNSEFPSKIEMWLWRSFCIAMACGPLIIAFTFFVRYCDGRLRRAGRYAAPEKGRPSKWRRWTGYALCSFIFSEFWVVGQGVASGFAAGRPFLLAESLASLRSPPNGTYNTIGWTSVVPHVA